MMSATGTLTIGRLAKAAEVGIETIRYYQQRALLPLPEAVQGAFRHYPEELVDRIRFIKRAQSLGFTLDEIGALLQLNDGVNRRSIRKLASERLDHTRHKINDLQRMESVLSELIHECESTDCARSCPIITSLAGKSDKLASITDNKSKRS
jgi:Hg(II)-responsive transcriptional regulator